MDLHPTSASTADLERIGDAIAELSAHLEAASGRLLDLIRDFDARGGWKIDVLHPLANEKRTAA
jgi:hypothetical protein